MDEQGGAGGVPLHGEDDARRRHGPRTERAGTGREPRPAPAPGPVRREDTDEASRLDRPTAPERPRQHRDHGAHD
ncbi:hypothetical protein [Streptomyces sp. NPDC059708]|uniref:hypothetical protein n=1 Tax=Streptomyces sp. NPDC059708 TaxID=3346916 RepID=UPI0036BDB450